MISNDWQSQIFQKKNGGSNLGLMGLNQAQNKVFRHLLEFGSYAFLEIAQNDSFRQCISPSRGEIHEKKFEFQIWAKQAKISPKIRLFAIFSS